MNVSKRNYGVVLENHFRSDFDKGAGAVFEIFEEIILLLGIVFDHKVAFPKAFLVRREHIIVNWIWTLKIRRKTLPAQNLYRNRRNHL